MTTHTAMSESDKSGKPELKATVMNENNQPQSQQKTRLGCTTCNGAGQYDTDVGPLECGHCGGTGYIEYDSEPSHSPTEQPQSQQTPESAPNENYQYEKFTESQKYWYEMYAQGKPSSESSHSPTEQPGDAKHTPGPWYISDSSDLYVVQKNGPEEYGICKMLTQWDDSERLNNAELIARAPALLSEVETLREENARLKAECSSHEKERYEIYSFDSSQAMEIKALQKELEQLRSERDKMREENSNLKKELQQYHDSINPEMQP